MQYFHIALYAAVSAFGLYLLKAAPKVVSAPFLAGLLLYAGGFAYWLWLLRLYPLSKIFPVAAGAIVLATQVLGLLLLREGIDGRKLAGIAAIMIGIVLLTPSSS